MGQRKWTDILETAVSIMNSYDTPVTLRQLFYRLVSIGVLQNTQSDYTQLSKYTAEGRRADTFPDFVDRTRQIYENLSFTDPTEARRWLARMYRRDRTEGQEFSIYLGVEKEGIVAQLDSWFGDYGVPLLALRGYASQSYVDQIKRHVYRQDRPAVLIYAGDFDSSGKDILRDFSERTGCFDYIHRIALNEQQIITYNLPKQTGKTTDSRSVAFILEHGELIQVELDALPPDILRKLYRDTFDLYFDESTYLQVIEREQEEAKQLTRTVGE